MEPDLLAGIKFCGCNTLCLLNQFVLPDRMSDLRKPVFFFENKLSGWKRLSGWNHVVWPDLFCVTGAMFPVWEPDCLDRLICFGKIWVV